MPEGYGIFIHCKPQEKDGVVREDTYMFVRIGATSEAWGDADSAGLYQHRPEPVPLASGVYTPRRVAVRYVQALE